MDWVLGLFAAIGFFLLCTKDKAELINRRLQKKASVHEKLQQMLHIRKGFEISDAVIKFPFAEHPKLSGIALDQQARQMCLISGDFEHEQMSVRLLSFQDLQQAEVLVNELSLFAPLSEPAALAHSRLPDTCHVKSVILRLHLKDQTYPRHEINFIETAKGGEAEAVQEAKKWHWQLSQLSN